MIPQRRWTHVKVPLQAAQLAKASADPTKLLWLWKLSEDLSRSKDGLADSWPSELRSQDSSSTPIGCAKEAAKSSGFGALRRTWDRCTAGGVFLALAVRERMLALLLTGRS